MISISMIATTKLTDEPGPFVFLILKRSSEKVGIGLVHIKDERENVNETSGQSTMQDKAHHLRAILTCKKSRVML